MSVQFISRITASLHPNCTNEIIHSLKSAGIESIYLQDARKPVVSRNTSISSVFRGRKSILNIPAKILSFYSREEDTKSVLSLISSIGKLHIPGRGTAYAERFTRHSVSTDDELPTLVIKDYQSQAPIINNLIGICCIVQRGEGDYLADHLLEKGFESPTITYGNGTGLREKIGLFRIMVPAEKEVLYTTVPSWGVHDLMSTLIDKGRLDLPGRGFVNTFPISWGITTAAGSMESSYQAASIEQIISALDTINGGVDWRKQDYTTTRHKERPYISGVDLQITCNVDAGVQLVKAAMEAGGTGATIEQVRLISSSHKKDSTFPAQERCKMLVHPSKLNDIISSICNTSNENKDYTNHIITQEVNQAFTYMKAAS